MCVQELPSPPVPHEYTFSKDLQRHHPLIKKVETGRSCKCLQCSKKPKATPWAHHTSPA